MLRNSLDSERYPYFNYIVALIGMLFFGWLSVHMGQDLNFDLRNYHFYNPYALLNGRLGFDYSPADIQTYINPLLDLPFYFLENNLTPKWVGFILGAIHGINFLLVYLITYTLFSLEDSGLFVKDKWRRRILSFASAAVGVSGIVNICELGTSYQDNFVSLFTLLSLLMIIRTLAAPKSTDSKHVLYNILFAGIVMGISAGAKLTSMIFVIGGMAAVPTLMERPKDRLYSVLAFGGGAFFGLLLSHGWWSIILWKLFKSPIFPFYNKFFQSPYFYLSNFSDKSFFPRDLSQTLFYPFYFTKINRLALRSPFRDIRLAVIYSLVVFSFIKAVLFRFLHSGSDSGNASIKNETKMALFFTTFFVACYIVWLTMFSNYRFVASLEFICPVLVILLLSYILRSTSKKTLSAVVIIVFLAMAFTVKYPNRGRTYWSKDYFDVKIPRVNYDEGTMIFIASREAMGFMIPAFPEHIRFVNVVINDRGFGPVIAALIEKQTAPMYVIRPYFSYGGGQKKTEDIRNQTIKHLGKFGLKMQSNTCRNILHKEANVGLGKHYLCEVTRITD